jgi:LysM repeat protein
MTNTYSQSLLMKRVSDYMERAKPNTGYTEAAMKAVLQAHLPDNTFILTQLMLQYDGKETAQDFVGVFAERRLPYKDDDSLDGTGDCSSFPGVVYEMLCDISIGSWTEEIWKRYKKNQVDVANLREGDLIFWNFKEGRNVSHMATYLGGGWMIHTTSPKNPLRIEKLNDYSPHKRVGCCRVLSDAEYTALMSQNIVRDLYNDAPEPKPNPVDGEFHTVAKGDSMWKIAKAYRMSYTLLLNMNPDIKDPSLIHPGDRIRVMAPTAQYMYIGATFVNLRESVPSGKVVAIIRKGEKVFDLKESKTSGNTKWWKVKHITSGKTGWCAYPNLFKKV